tara:strand:- start:739 stop:1113 length:375 start_codon:yes stop_codon:yes gene_type:complete
LHFVSFPFFLNTSPKGECLKKMGRTHLTLTIGFVFSSCFSEPYTLNPLVLLATDVITVSLMPDAPCLMGDERTLVQRASCITLTMHRASHILHHIASRIVHHRIGQRDRASGQGAGGRIAYICL